MSCLTMVASSSHCHEDAKETQPSYHVFEKLHNIRYLFARMILSCSGNQKECCKENAI